jgi:hypothetical protein
MVRLQMRWKRLVCFFEKLLREIERKATYQAVALVLVSTLSTALHLYKLGDLSHFFVAQRARNKRLVA